ncbi:MAG: hypothetical protein OHK0022_58230 [Roseiflexaceae bacterium]
MGTLATSTILVVFTVAICSAQGTMSQRLAWLFGLLSAAVFVFATGWEVALSLVMPFGTAAVFGIWLLLTVLGSLIFQVLVRLLAAILVGQGVWPKPTSPVYQAIAILRNQGLEPHEVVRRVQQRYLVPSKVVLTLLGNN